MLALRKTMRNFVVLALLALITFGTSCSDKINVGAPYKDVMVVYGILNIRDSAHYIRIQKGFMDENKSAVNMAKEYDSSYFKDLDVSLQQVHPDNGTILNTFPLVRVDLANEGFPKETSGAFFNTPNYAYKIITPTKPYSFNEFHDYRLVIKNKTTGRIDSSARFAFVSGDTAFDSSGSFYISKFQTFKLAVKFAQTTSPHYKLEIQGNTPLNGKLIEGHLIFHYTDSDVVAGTGTRKTVDYLFGTDVREPRAPFKLEVENAAIYRFLLDEIGPAPSNISRYFDSLDIAVLAGSDEIFTYQQITSGQKGGLTGDQIQPTYTNMKGTDVLGIIGTRSHNIYYSAGIDEVTMDSIVKSNYLSPLSIKGRTPY